MTAEAKIRTLAAADTTLQGFFGTNPFRWFHVQLPPGYVLRGTGKTCVRVQQITTGTLYAQEGRVDLNQVRFQFTILDPDATVVDAAAEAVIAFFDRISLATDDLFASPPVTPTQHPNFLINDISGVEPQTKPPIPTRLLDFRLWNKSR